MKGTARVAVCNERLCSMAKCPNSLYKTRTNTDTNMLPPPDSLDGSNVGNHTAVLANGIAASQLNILTNKFADPQQLTS